MLALETPPFYDDKYASSLKSIVWSLNIIIFSWAPKMLSKFYYTVEFLSEFSSRF